MLYKVYGVVTGSKYLGEFEADTAEEAVDLALESDEACCCLCHACSRECEDPSIESATAEPIQ